MNPRSVPVRCVIRLDGFERPNHGFGGTLASTTAGGLFLDHLLREAARHGFTEITLAGGGADQLLHYTGVRCLAGRDVHIRVVAPAEPGRTSGSLIGSGGADGVLLLDGTSWLDTDLRAFVTALPDWAHARLAVHKAPAAAATGRVGMADGRVTYGVADAASDHVAAGVCFVRDLSPAALASAGSFTDQLAAWAREGSLEAWPADAFFVSAAAAGRGPESPLRRRRPTIFFDRDGVLNCEGSGYTHKPEDLCWVENAREAVRFANRSGWYVFVITNQAGIARGLYDEAAVLRFHAHMDVELARVGAHVDEYRYCPFHPDGTVAEYRRDSECRKPKPGMILDLMREWPVDAGRSVVIGDRPSDCAAAAAAGIHGHLFVGEGDLLAVVQDLMRRIGA